MTGATNEGLILALNCGSSSIKFALFDMDCEPLSRTSTWRGKVDGIGSLQSVFDDGHGARLPLTLDASQPFHAALELLRERILERLKGRPIVGIAHRVVHGGNKYFEPVRIDAVVLADLKTYIPLAPLHQPFALEAIAIMLASLPNVPQIACFDTAFHHTLPDVETLLPLPRTLQDPGLRRYGFHGLSYAYLSLALGERYGEAARGRTIVAHIGSGASLCAMRNLRSVATTMGFSALDGLMMGTRCGSLDPGVVLYLMETHGLSLQGVGHLLYHDSGLLGVSGRSPDPGLLLAHEDEAPVREALALYVHRIVRELGALAATLDGLDMLTFSAGIGEHNATIRERVCARLGFLGVVIDPAANAANAPVISGASSKVLVTIEPTNEEWVAASAAAAILVA